MENLNNDDKELIRLKNLPPKNFYIIECNNISPEINISLLKKMCGNDTVQVSPINIVKSDIFETCDGIGCFVHETYFSS